MLGDQTPRFQCVPEARASLGDDAVRFAAKAGLHLDPWQQLVLRGALGVAPGGLWAARNVTLLVPRQNGKGSILEALELFHLFVLGTRTIVHSAHKFDTSQEHFLRMRTLIEGNPDLEKHVAAAPTANGKEAIILKSGARLKFKARTVGGAGRGFSADLVILDEAMLLPEAAIDAMRPTLAARPRAQIWYTSSAGMPESTVLWRQVKRGRAGSPGMAYFEWGCESGADPTDRREWARANPGLGFHLQEQALEDDLAELSPEGFAREHLGIWDEMSRPSVFPEDSWENTGDAQSALAGPPSFGVEVAQDRSWSCIGAAGRRPDGLMHAQVAENYPGTDWVPGKLVELGVEEVAIQPNSPAGSLIPAIEARGIRVEKLSGIDYAAACGHFYDLVKDKLIRHLLQGEVDTAVAGAEKRLTPEGAWVLERKGDVDISPLVAEVLAVHLASMERASVYEERGVRFL